MKQEKINRVVGRDISQPATFIETNSIYIKIKFLILTFLDELAKKFKYCAWHNH